MPKLIDLRPSDYREKGRQKPRWYPSDKLLKGGMIACGIYFAAVWYFYRAVFPVEPGWWALVIGGLPGLALWLYVIISAKD